MVLKVLHLFVDTFCEKKNKKAEYLREVDSDMQHQVPKKVTVI